MLTKKRGLSLIEVIVSLSILMMVFGATVTLLVNALNLAMITRDKTEANAAAQKGLADAVAKIQSCGGTNTPPTTQTVNDKTLTVTFDSFDPLEVLDSSKNVAGSIDTFHYIKITSTVTWDYRGQSNKIVAYQYVRKP